ncbi:glutaredoxin family protein [Rarobacter incanus]|uniref:Glutaredoxin-like protein DUF836 n=1 Tax=Rarobacter incanus TaxID=153494 RepID=A0A542SQR4_9MICO|nr:glutaredoxin family protein [Rarobacter incanus]TQK76944.1 glutaredoxin-like protein DUF836 [Rarobacter incanus]
MDTPVELIVTQGCSLCGPAAAVVEKVCAEMAVAWRVIDIAFGRAVTHGDDGEHSQWLAEGELHELRQRWAHSVPVVIVDGAVQGIFTIDVDRLRAALGGGGRRLRA